MFTSLLRKRKTKEPQKSLRELRLEYYEPSTEPNTESMTEEEYQDWLDKQNYVNEDWNRRIKAKQERDAYTKAALKPATKEELAEAAAAESENEEIWSNNALGERVEYEKAKAYYNSLKNDNYLQLRPEILERYHPDSKKYVSVTSYNPFLGGKRTKRRRRNTKRRHTKRRRTRRYTRR